MFIITYPKIIYNYKNLVLCITKKNHNTIFVRFSPHIVVKLYALRSFLSVEKQKHFFLDADHLFSQPLPLSFSSSHLLQGVH